MNLREIEERGYKLDVEAGSLAVYGPRELLTDEQLEPLRLHKQELIDQVVLRKFCNLVRAYATDHQVLLTESMIAWELDADDVVCLRDMDTHDKQVWAQLLAYRMTKGWTAADQLLTEVLH